MRYSRITGEPIDESRPKKLSDKEIAIGLGKVGELMRIDNRVNDTSSLKYLFMEWCFPKDLIEEIYTYMGNSFDETNEFLNRLDGCSSLKEAWDSHTREYDCEHEPFPFKKDYKKQK